jgi:hypothetical protein
MNENITHYRLIEYLDDFGGFPPLYAERWQSKLSFEQLLARLHLQFNIEPLFELKVAADDMNNTQHIILVRILNDNILISFVCCLSRSIIHPYFFKHRLPMNPKMK